MKFSYKFVFGVVFLLSLLQLSYASTVRLESGYIRETIPGTRVSAAYVLIHNDHDHDIELVSVTSSLDSRIELHEHMMTDNMMRMRQIASIVIPANSFVKLQPSGYHIMFLDLGSRLSAGQNIELTFNFYKHPATTITLPVRSIKDIRAQY